MAAVMPQAMRMGDLPSHIFPGIHHLADALKQTNFDFAASPFHEVRFLSAFGGHRLRVYPGMVSNG